MLGLKLPTDERWVRLVESNLEEVLTDHAWCEQKAASNAISTIVHFSEYPELVDTLSAIAIEEMTHFRQVVELIRARGWTLGRERKDDYVNELLQFVRKGPDRETYLVDRLLFAAMIEARSCERFRLLSEKVGDEQLAAFYRELMISEAQHYTTFINLARKLAPRADVDHRWHEFLEYEAQVIARYGKRETIHG